MCPAEERHPWRLRAPKLVQSSFFQIRVPLSLVFLCLVSAPGSASGQTPEVEGEAPDLLFTISDVGLYLPPRWVLDWGAMMRLGERNAAGLGLFAMNSRSETGATFAGPWLRYRRLIGEQGSIEAAIGITVTADSDDATAGTYFGLVKYSPIPSLGLAIRPERLRRTLYQTTFDEVTHEPIGVSEMTRTSYRYFAGVEARGQPGWLASIGIVSAIVLLSVPGD